MSRRPLIFHKHTLTQEVAVYSKYLNIIFLYNRLCLFYRVFVYIGPFSGRILSLVVLWVFSMRIMLKYCSSSQCLLRLAGLVPVLLSNWLRVISFRCLISWWICLMRSEVLRFIMLRFCRMFYI